MKILDKLGLMGGSVLTMYANEIGTYASQFAEGYEALGYIAATGLCLTVSIPTIAYCYQSEVGNIR